MALTYQLIVLLGLSSGLWMGANAGCPSDCCLICPDGWSAHDSRCFQFVSSPKSWSDAESECVTKGGNLASAHDAEVKYYRDLVKQSTGAATPTWFGGFKTKVGAWKWSRDEHFKFTKWGKGEPSDQTGAENCMEMMSTNKHGEEQPFNGAPCDAKKAYLCVRDRVATN